MTERWLPVPHYEGLYEVSDLGRVRSLKNGLLKPAIDRKRNRLKVMLSKQNMKANHPVHRLVLEAFVGPRPPNKMARHFPDQDWTNNRLDNLSWETAAINQHDRVANGTRYRRQK